MEVNAEKIYKSTLKIDIIDAHLNAPRKQNVTLRSLTDLVSFASEVHR